MLPPLQPELPLVRIGIVTRNRPELLRRSIESCRRQTYPRIEIVVRDNSDDVSAVRRNAATARDFPQVRWSRRAERQSLIESRADLMAEPGAEFFCSIDDDAWFLKDDEISLAAAYLQNGESLAGVAFDILSPDNSSPVIRCSPLPTMGFLGCGHMLRVRMVQEVGSYADFPGHYGSEEKDLCIRFLDRGWSLLALPGVHVWHDKSTAGRDWAAQHRSGTLNDMVFGLLRAPLPDLFYYLPGKAFKLVLWGLKGSREERWSGLAGLLDFVRHAPACLVQRAPVRRSTFRHFTGGDGGKTQKPRDWEGRVR